MRPLQKKLYVVLVADCQITSLAIGRSVAGLMKRLNNREYILRFCFVLRSLPLKLQFYVQRNHFSASTNEIPPQITSTSIRPPWLANEEPSRIVARSASFKAVSGKALING